MKEFLNLMSKMVGRDPYEELSVPWQLLVRCRPEVGKRFFLHNLRSSSCFATQLWIQLNLEFSRSNSQHPDAFNSMADMLMCAGSLQSLQTYRSRPLSSQGRAQGLRQTRGRPRQREGSSGGLWALGLEFRI